MAEKDPGRFAVGDVVHVRDINRAHLWTGVVEKVGRTLVHVREGSDVRTYRIRDGRRNDRWGHQSIRTEDEEQQALRRESALAGVWAVFGPRGLRTDTLSTVALEAVRDALAAIPEEERWA